MKQNKIFKIRLVNLITLNRWLRTLPLSVKQTKERTKFLELCGDVAFKAEERRLEILKKYARKDDKGEFLTYEDENGRLNYDLTDEERKKVEEEYNKVLDETVELPLDGNKAKFDCVADILRTTDFKFSGVLAEQYVIWCQAFDELDK